MTILVFCAHSDDQIVGAGGSLAKYVKDGEKVIVVIFSYGELGDPILKKDIAKRQRVEESIRVGEFLGIRETIFLGAPDTKIKKKVKDAKFIKKVEDLIKKYKPSKIFTHAISDIHPGGDHIAVNKIVFKATKNIDWKGDLFTFDIWNPFDIFSKKNLPVMYVDISDTFDLKMKALRMFESQIGWVYSLLPGIFIKAKIDGIKNRYRYAEKFYKIR